MADDLKAIVQRMIDAGESEENIATVIQGYGSSSPKQASLEPVMAGGGNGSLGLAAMKSFVPMAQKGVEELATHPGVARMGQRFGAVAGGIGGLVKTANPLGAMGGMMAGGKLGNLLGQAAQSVAGPIAKGAGAVAPFAQTLGTLSGAQGVGDLAQMAEPTRKDIGFLGIGKTRDVPGQKPALLNSLFSRFVKIGPETQ